jgi:hypothetical protein
LRGTAWPVHFGGSIGCQWGFLSDGSRVLKKTFLWPLVLSLGKGEGEDWAAEIKLFDVATTHVYWRCVVRSLKMQKGAQVTDIL